MLVCVNCEHFVFRDGKDYYKSDCEFFRKHGVKMYSKEQEAIKNSRNGCPYYTGGYEYGTR